MGPVLYPAIDVRGGQVVRLTNGDYGRETVYGSDPVAVAQRFANAGARWVHIVDLDAARSGDPVNRSTIGAVVAALDGTARVQTGGGVRSAADAKMLADVGVSRVVMGSAAMADPDVVNEAAKFIDVAVGLDHRDGDIAVHGWTAASGVQVREALTLFPAAAAFVITDISRDGTLNGPDIAGLRAAVAATAIDVIASGGVASLDDVAALANIEGLAGIITGKALYEGRFSVAEALELLERQRAADLHQNAGPQ